MIGREERNDRRTRTLKFAHLELGLGCRTTTEPATSWPALTNVDRTFRVGKGGIDTVAKELRDQLRDRELVKTSLRVVCGRPSTDELAMELTERAEAELVEIRGHTAIYH